MLVLTSLVAVSAHATCTLQFDPTTTGGRLASNTTAQLRWFPVPGAAEYRVEWTQQPSSLSNSSTTTLTFRTIFHIVLKETVVRYRVSAVNESDPTFVPCSAVATYTVVPDAALVRAAERLIIPIAGSARGVNGARFTTRLALRSTPHRDFYCPLCPPPTGYVTSGRVMFHPAGRPASENDPSLRYRLLDWNTVVYEDVMAAIGATGLGWLELVPDAGSYMPYDAEAWIFNVGGNVKVGTRVEGVFGRDHYDSVRDVETVVTDPEQERMSIGALLLAGAGRLDIRLRRPDGSVAVGRPVEVKADTLEHVSLSSIFPDTTINAGDVVHVHFLGAQGTSIGVVYLTTTNNTTNDAEIILSRPTGTLRNGSLVD